MTRMEQQGNKRRARRSFTAEYKAGAVKLVLDEGKTIAQVARDLDLAESALRTWVVQARADRSQGQTGLTSEEREELRRLRKELRVVKMERDILGKAVAFFAKNREPGSNS
jgi:transposase